MRDIEITLTGNALPNYPDYTLIRHTRVRAKIGQWTNQLAGVLHRQVHMGFRRKHYLPQIYTDISAKTSGRRTWYLQLG